MRDLRDTLPRADWSLGHRAGPPSGATLHYNGPPVAAAGNVAGELAQLATDARYHLRPGVIAPGGADGIQYHYAVLSSGEVCRLRDDDAILWHCANTAGNRDHLAIALPLGGAQIPTATQWQATTDLFAALMLRYGWTDRGAIKGHREWPRSDGKPQKSCPGPVIFRLLQQWRGELAADARYRIAVDTALIREGPGQQYRVALGGTAQLHRGDPFTVGAIVPGTPPAGHLNPNWLWLRSGVGFVHASLAVRYA